MTILRAAHDTVRARRRALAAAAALAGTLVTLDAQPTFRSTVDLVTVPVTVTSRDGRRGELGAGDFRVYEDGVRQQLAVISHEPRPLSLCILLDSSPSMAPRQALATRAIDTLLRELAPDDEVALLMFAARVRVAIPWTRASQARSFSWYSWRLSLGTALIDAVKEALELMELATHPQPVMLIVSDGADTISGTPLSKLAATRRQSETMVYGVHTASAPARGPTPLNRAFAVDFLPDLVGDSGGTVYRVRDADGAEGAALGLLQELRSQYTLGYEPKRPFDGQYRRVKIEAVDPSLTVRHREGYLAAPR